ncbi:MAG TPA: hypothetical protein VNG93_04325 [Candidatus Dormibacteraeota bacterium]|nr:hypothetical protein [Candidatus Dormibacteraeota bacterium]
MSLPLDPVSWFWQTVADAIHGSAGDVTSLVSGFLFATTDILAGGRPFTEASTIANFQPVVVVIADASLGAVVAWGCYQIMFGHGISSLYTVRILLPRLLLAIVLVNFSLPLMQAAIDVNNALCSAVLGVGLAFNPSSLFALGDLGRGSALSLAVLAALFGGYAVLGVGYALRYSLLVVLAITAPVAAILSVLPDTQHFAKKWGELFLATLLMQPLQLLVLQVGLQLDLGTAAWNPVRHVFALATLLLAFKVPGALSSTSSAGSHAMSAVKHFAHLAVHGTGHAA